MNLVKSGMRRRIPQSNQGNTPADNESSPKSAAGPEPRRLALPQHGISVSGYASERRQALLRFAEELADLAAELYARGDLPLAESKKKSDGPDGGAEGNDK